MIRAEERNGYDYHSYLLCLVVVIITWGIVPGFAKLGNLPGDITSFWINWIAIATLLVIISVQKRWSSFRGYRVKDYLGMAALGLIWPLLFSISYFEAVQRGGPALTTILLYTWPIFYLIFSYLISKKKVSRMSGISIFLAVVAVGTTCFFENRTQITFASAGIILGLIAAASQGFYSFATDRWKCNPWVMVLIIEAVTVIGVSVIVALQKSFVVPTLSTFFYLGVIGVFSNAIGFWAFTAGTQRSTKSKRSKSVWLIGMCFVPFVQILFLPIIGAENVTPWKWLGIILVAVSLLVNRFQRKAETYLKSPF